MALLSLSLVAPAPGTTTATPTPAPPAAGAVVRADAVPVSFDVAELHALRVSRSLAARTRTPVVAAKSAAPKKVERPKAQATSKPKPSHTSSASVPSHYGTTYLTAMAKCIRSHESGVYTRNSGNGYYGAYQFSDSTWHSQTGLSGHASDYSKAVQDYWFMHTWAKLKTDRVRQQQWTTYRFCSYIRP